MPVTPTFVESGSGISPILDYANMTFNAHMGNGETFKMTIKNVAFVPEYLTSVISWKLLKNKNVKWNTDSNILSYNGKLICKLLERHDHDVFTAEPIPDNVQQIQNIPKNHSNLSVDNMSNSLLSKLSNQETKSSPNGLINSIKPRKSVGSESLWHQRLGHLGREALRYIQSETVKLEVNGPKTVDCKDYAINKVVKIISRRKSDRATALFERIHFDLVAYSPIGFDGSKYMLHFTDDLSKMNFVYLLVNKTGPNLFRHFRNFVAYIKRQYERDFKIFRCNQESGLGISFENWLEELGLEIEWSAVATSEQNGLSERSGGMIQTKARCPGNGANLPHENWPEYVMTAAYLINRTPTSTLGWLSPLSKLRKYLNVPDRDE